MGVSTVGASVTDVTILASNSARQTARIFNDSTATLYLLCVNATSSATQFSVTLSSGAYFVVPFRYTGAIKGIWTAADGGFARITET